MAKSQLRHIAISVPNKDTAAKFYEETFGLERVSESRVATRLTDGVMNLTLLQFELKKTQATIEERILLAYITLVFGLMTRKLLSPM